MNGIFFCRNLKKKFWLFLNQIEIFTDTLYYIARSRHHNSFSCWHKPLRLIKRTTINTQRNKAIYGFLGPWLMYLCSYIMCTEIFTYLAHQEKYVNHKIVLTVLKFPSFLPFFLLNYQCKEKNIFIIYLSFSYYRQNWKY